MSLNEVYKYSPEKVRERTVPTGTLPGSPLLINTRPCVTITAASDAQKTFTYGDGSTRTIPLRGASQTTSPISATVAFDGTWEFAVTGATTSTAQDVAVYITSGNALTLTSTSNTLYGYTDYPTSYTKTSGRAAVRVIGS